MAPASDSEDISLKTNAKCVLVGAKNWRLWSLKIEAQLRIHGAWAILRKDFDSLDDSEKKEVTKKEEVAIGIVLSALSDDIIEGLPSYRGITELWEHLRQKFGGTDKTQSIQGLQAVMGTHSAYCSSIEDYVSKIESGIRQMKSRLKANEAFPEWFFTDLLLANLDESWETFITLILNEKKDIPFKDLAARMIEQERRMKYQDTVINIVKAKKVKQNAKKSSKSDVRCGNCNKRGHTEENCWELHPEKRPKRLQESAKRVNTDDADDGHASLFNPEPKLHGGATVL